MTEKRSGISESGESINKSQILLRELESEFSHNFPDSYIELVKEFGSVFASADTSDIDELGYAGFSELFNSVIVSNEWDEGFPDNGILRKDWSEFQGDKAPLTKIGQFIREKIAGDTLIDLGCGVGHKVISTWAEIFNAKRYIGVDTEEIDVAYERDNFTEFRLRGDMLLFVAKLPDSYGSFYISGIEDLRSESIAYQKGDKDNYSPNLYMEALLKEIYRATRSGGLLIIGANTNLPDPEKIGFKRIYFDNLPKGDYEKETFVYIK